MCFVQARNVLTNKHNTDYSLKSLVVYYINLHYYLGQKKERKGDFGWHENMVYELVYEDWYN